MARAVFFSVFIFNPLLPNTKNPATWRDIASLESSSLQMYFQQRYLKREFAAFANGGKPEEGKEECLAVGS